MTLRFDKIGENVKLDPNERYKIPENATHVGLKNGMIAFFWSPNSKDIHKSGKRWLFMRLPEGVKALIFPEVKQTNSGWCYGIESACNCKRIDG